MGTASGQFEIADVIIAWIVVFVMNYFDICQFASEMFSHDQPMDKKRCDVIRPRI